MHPKFGPFTIQCLDKENDKYTILNQKGDRTFTFKGIQYQLDTGGTNFDLDHLATYSAVCLPGTKIFWDELMVAQNNKVPAANSDNGPFCIST